MSWNLRFKLKKTLKTLQFINNSTVNFVIHSWLFITINIENISPKTVLYSMEALKWPKCNCRSRRKFFHILKKRNCHLAHLSRLYQDTGKKFFTSTMTKTADFNFILYMQVSTRISQNAKTLVIENLSREAHKGLL